MHKKIVKEDGRISVEDLTAEDYMYLDTLTVSPEVADIIQELVDKNARLAQRLAGVSNYVSANLKSVMHQAYLEGAKAQEDVTFESKMLGEDIELPLPYASSGFGVPVDLEYRLDTEDTV